MKRRAYLLVTLCVILILCSSCNRKYNRTYETGGVAGGGFILCANGRVYSGKMLTPLYVETHEEEASIIPESPRIDGYITKRASQGTSYVLEDDLWTYDGPRYNGGIPYSVLDDQTIIALTEHGYWMIFTYTCDAKDYKG